MLPQPPPTAAEPPRGPSAIREKVAAWGAAIVVVLLSPGTLILLIPGPLDILGWEYLAFVWGLAGIGYLLGVWFCVEAQRKGMNGVLWGLLFAGPWWPLVLVLYAFSSYDRPVVHPPA